VTEDNLFYRCELPVLHDEILPNNMKQDEWPQHLHPTGYGYSPR
jgi:hypothetical protein